MDDELVNNTAEQEIPDRNASASAFGWDFQINAGIVIMLDCIKDATAVKVEGKTQDIEVSLKDGSRLFAQAKSAMNPEDGTNANRDLVSALQTLRESDRSGCAKELIFVTNRDDPLKNESSRRKFSTPYAKVRYGELPLECQERISEICSQSHLALRSDRFYVMTLVFSGDGDSRYETIKGRVSDFLADIDANLIAYRKKALDRWQLQFGKNASQKDRNRTIKKEDMIWPLIAWLCENYDDPLIDDFDDADREEIEERFSGVISEQSERFGFVSKVMSEFERLRNANPEKTRAEILKVFLAEKCDQFAEEFDLTGVDPEIASGVRRFTIAKILRERHKIFKIKNAVNL